MAEPAIEVRELRRTYRARGGLIRRNVTEVEALKGISLTVERGELYGLLGPNGAGKTTAIKVLTTLLAPTGGEVRVLLVGLRGREAERVEGYSRGMRQRLHIARALLHQPEVLFLDEPTIGIDAVGARDVRAIVEGLHAGGTTILLTTHYLFEADALCDRIGIIDGGTIRAEGTPDDLKREVQDGQVVEIQAFGAEAGHVQAIRGLAGVTLVVVDEAAEQEQRIAVHTRPDADDPTAAAVAALDGVRLGRIAYREPTLEDAYIAIVEAG